MQDRMIEDDDLTAYCGIYCKDCIRYNCRASVLTSELLEEIDNDHFRSYDRVKSRQEEAFENLDTTITTLKALTAINCTVPCRTACEGSNEYCDIFSCVRERNMSGCWECPDFEKCEKLGYLKRFHGDGLIHNLKMIKRFGLEKWPCYRAECYPWL